MLIHFPLGKCWCGDTQGRAVNTCSSCSFPGRHLPRPGGAPFPGAGRSPSNPAPNRFPCCEPWFHLVPAQGLLPHLNRTACRGTGALTRLTRKPSFRTPAASCIVASGAESRAPDEKHPNPGSLSLCTRFKKAHFSLYSPPPT